MEEKIQVINMKVKQSTLERAQSTKRVGPIMKRPSHCTLCKTLGLHQRGTLGMP